MITASYLLAFLAWSNIGPWEVGEGFGDRSTCTMAQTFRVGDSNKALGVTFSPLKRTVRINADKEKWRLGSEAREITVSFSPSEIDFTARGQTVEMPGGDALTVEIDDLLVLDLLARSDHILVADEYGNALRFPLKSSTSAIATLKSCAGNRLNS